MVVARKRRADEATDEIMERIGIADVAGERVDKLPTGTARLVELGRALATHPRVLLLDEPSAGLNEAETPPSGALLRDLAGTGLAVLLVEHDMAFVMGTCERIHVLDFGRIIAAGLARRRAGDPRCAPPTSERAARSRPRRSSVDVAAAEAARTAAAAR